MISVLETALKAVENEISVIPILPDGSKKPAFAWKQYQQTKAGKSILTGWWKFNPAFGMAMIGGQVSKNLECIDFDNAEYLDLFREAAIQVGLGPLYFRVARGYLEKTPNGYHLVYRCPDGVEGNQKLALGQDDAGNLKALIETRGEGGYFIAAPTNGKVHPSGGKYEMVSGDLESIVTISAAERKALHGLARGFNEVETGQPEPETWRSESGQGQGDRVGDEFNARATWEEVLGPHGWQIVFRTGRKLAWRRPGKDEGISATTGHAGTDYLYVFSTSTIFQAERGYSKFSAYTLLNHDGDFQAATKDLAGKGYGRPPVPAGTDFSGFTGAAVDKETGEIVNNRPHTDYGNAERLVDHFGHMIHYCHEMDWLIWDGVRWVPDKSGRLMQFAKETVRKMYGEAEAILDTNARKKLATHALNSEKRDRLKAMIDLAKDEKTVPALAADLDTNPMLLNVLNGTIDLTTGACLPHNRENLITKLAPVTYKKNAVCPVWSDFLDRVFNGDQDMVRFIKQAVGYTLTGLTVEQIFFLLYGTGSNGKSTFLETLKIMLGDYAKATNFTTFLESKSDTIRNDLAGIAGTRFVVAKEAKSGRGFDESVVKELTGGDTISARFLRKEYFEFKPTFKIWLAANHKPRIKEQSTGIWRRVRLIPFEIQILEEDADRNFGKKLEAEMPGILNWAIEGCLEWQQAGRLVSPKRVKDATDLYKSESDRLREFIQENCQTGKASKHNVPLSQIHKVYAAWCKQNDEFPLGKMSFRSALEERGYPSGNGTGNVVTVYGISLIGGEN